MESLAEAIPKEQARVRELMGIYKSLGSSGAIGAALMEHSLREADQAVMSGDVAQMMAAYEDLKSWEE